MTGRQRKSKNFTAPANPAPRPGTIPTPQQENRIFELFLLSLALQSAAHEWLTQADGEFEIELAEAFAVSLPPEAKQVLEAALEVDATTAFANLAEGPKGHLVPLLYAFTDRLLSIELPDSKADLFGGPPIAMRHRAPVSADDGSES